MSKFFGRRANPATIPTDTIIPLHYFDDNFVFRCIINDFTMRFDDVLDTEKLRISLARLLELGNWRKLGARLRLNKNGKLEYHVPAYYDEKRPGFSYSHVNYDTNIEDHPLASKLPKMTTSPSVQVGPAQINPLARRPDAPKTIKDYIYTDEPQLSLHIVSFKDATLVSITWIHTFLDILGQAAIFDAWTLVLSGKEDQVQPLHGFDTDPLAPLGCIPSEKAEKHVVSDRQMHGLAVLIFLFRFVFELIWWPRERSQTVCLPASYIQSVRQTAIQELTSDGEKSAFLSEGDVVCAWFIRYAILHLSYDSERTVGLTNVLGLRGILSKDLLPAGTSYVANATSHVTAFMTAKDIFQKPLSFVASQVRRSIQEQGTRGQVESFLGLQRAAMDKRGFPALFGDTSTQLIVFTNWSKGKFFDVDFSTAVISQGISLADRANLLGRPSHVQAYGNLTRTPERYSFVVLGKDAVGNYWLSGRLRASIWDKIDREFKDNVR